MIVFWYAWLFLAKTFAGVLAKVLGCDNAEIGLLKNRIKHELSVTGETPFLLRIAGNSVSSLMIIQ